MSEDDKKWRDFFAALPEKLGEAIKRVRESDRLYDSEIERAVAAKDHARAAYKAANWLHLGETTGRGRLDAGGDAGLPIKSILIYPLARHFRRELCC